MKEKKRKAKKIRKVLKKRLNIDCLRMLCPKYCSELETEENETVRLDVTSQVVSDDWFMVREINETNEE